MRVLTIAPEFASIAGGAGIYVSEYARLFPKGHELHIVTANGKDPSNVRDTEFLGGNVIVHRIKGSAASFREDLTFKVDLASNLRMLVRDSGADIIHTSSRMPDALCSSKTARIPIAATVHSTIGSHLNVLNSSRPFGSTLSGRERFMLAFGRIMVLAENRYYKSDRHFICVSNWGKRDLIASKGVDEARVSTIRNGVDVSRFSPALRKTSGIMFPELDLIQAMKILYVGRFTYAKGFSHLVKTIEMATNDSNLHFVIAGSGQHEIPKNLKGRCTVVGQVRYRDIPHLYASCDALILPSLYENMPLTVLEAMASGCVPIASNVGGVGEIIRHGNNGLLVPPGNPSAIVSTIRSLSQDRDRMKTMAENARESVVEKFRIERVINETMTLFARICSDGPQLGEDGTGANVDG